MLDSKDLQAIAELISASEQRMTSRMDESISASEQRMIKRIDESISASEQRMIKRMDRSIVKSESMLLNEMERYDKKNEQRFAKIERDLKELMEIYHLTKYDHETIGIMVHTMENFDKRLTALEARMA